ncbi:uncharacterized protein PgNI_00552 [Pyricularia grisea]|uniref:C3H1-type domain-containing protein n=1 Tax=Pyricularia grisea TaxID=148305 RepID=A0A6P8BKW7_PYRGI|nr:uncharacterized protein PgNI_00552 [Pyricularia grisea]TLD17521.1 hypothetical protein PgNI_00552 [Pyricularia grisea]
MSAPNNPEARHLRSGSLTIPSTQGGRGNGAMSNNNNNNNNNNNMPGNQRFDGPRSPPNTAHVPCKFFRQGACQAGNACPFSHDLSNATENVCKYFAKVIIIPEPRLLSAALAIWARGMFDNDMEADPWNIAQGNCKFGPKCANIHVLPDGRRINYGKNGVTIAAAPINLGSRVNPPTYPHTSNSALTNSFMRNPDGYGGPNPYLAPEDQYGGHQLGRQPSMENGVPTIDTTYSSNPASMYGSPRDDDLSRFGMGLSPVAYKGLSVLDAPLPASFDSNGISHAARYGPWPSSMPSKFGLESASASLNTPKDPRTSETLKLLHTSAFGSSDHLSAASHESAVATGNSPPVGDEEYFGKRTMHSSSRFTKPRMLSASAPKGDRDDWDPGFMFFEEDYIPSTLANDVLTPQEKARRGSVRLTDDPSTSSGLIGNGSDASSLPKFGSLGASPSRWGPLFQRYRSEEDSDPNHHGHRMIPGKSMKNVASVFGHVGSPLRNSSLAIDAEMDSLANGNGSPSNRSRSESLTALTQQLQSTKIGDINNSSSPRLHPNSARGINGTGLGSSSLLGSRDRDFDPRGSTQRNVSSGSISSSGRFTTPIDEEDSAFVFSMEEEDDAAAAQSHMRTKKRASGGLGATGWSYAGVAAGNAKNGLSNGSKGRDGLGVSGR